MVGPSDYAPFPSVVGQVEQSAAGNSILRVGHVLPSGGWEQSEHVVLTPAERNILIDALVAQRDKP